jgi:iron(III) transport system substrate-binding protein
MEATAIVAGTANLEAAKTLVDWSINRTAGLLEAMIDNDFEFAANNRKAILAEWQSRYDSKSEPK